MLRVKARQDGAYIIYEFYDGTHQFYAQMEGKAARELAKEVEPLIRLAEEYAERDRLIKDTAILLRAGAPIALSDNQKIVEAAKQSAAWDSDLRRYMPMNGITSQESFGTPKIIQSAPRVKQ